MSSFLEIIFTKITSAVASIIIAVGLISAPAPQTELPSKAKVVVEVKQNTQEIERVKLEAEIKKAKTETARVKAEAEKARQKAEEAQVEQERLREAQRLTDQQAEENRLRVQDPQIKIEKCKIEARANINNFLEAGKLAVNEGQQNCIQGRIATTQQYLGGGANSPEIIASMYNLARSSCQGIATDVLNKLQTQSEEIYNQQYLDCLNK